MTDERNKQIIEDIVKEYAVFEYAFLDRDDITFSDKVRVICETECSNCGHSWACPPHIGAVNDCIDTCRQFKHAFIFSTVAEADSTFFDECLKERRDHEELSRQLLTEFSGKFDSVLMLTSGCVVCDECACPDDECRHPDKRTSSVESHGIVIMQTAADAGLSFDFGNNMVTYFSIIFYDSSYRADSAPEA